jgi:hypothetical protein
MKKRFECQAGATTAIKEGELCDISSGYPAPLASDKDCTAGILVIAAEEIKDGDRAGYYNFWVPREDDVWRFDLATAAATTRATAMYYSSSEQLKATGTNIIAYAVGDDHYPEAQGHLADGDVRDEGTTIRTVGYVHVTFRKACSYISKLLNA